MFNTCIERNRLRQSQERHGQIALYNIVKIHTKFDLTAQFIYLEFLVVPYAQYALLLTVLQM